MNSFSNAIGNAVGVADESQALVIKNIQRVQQGTNHYILNSGKCINSLCSL